MLVNKVVRERRAIPNMDICTGDLNLLITLKYVIHLFT
jgi:hypothetical protein